MQRKFYPYKRRKQRQHKMVLKGLPDIKHKAFEETIVDVYKVAKVIKLQKAKQGSRTRIPKREDQ